MDLVPFLYIVHGLERWNYIIDNHELTQYYTFLLAIKGATFLAVTVAAKHQYERHDNHLAKSHTFVIFSRDFLFYPFVIITSSKVIGRETK